MYPFADKSRGGGENCSKLAGLKTSKDLKALAGSRPLKARRTVSLPSLAVFLLCAMLLWGCADLSPGADIPEPDPGKEPVKIERKTVLSPVKMNYVVKNPIEWTDLEDTAGTDEAQGIHVGHHSIRIAGLADQTIQDKINEKIRETYDSLRKPDLPPFRGIKTAIPENALAVDSYIGVEVSANHSNILSVVFHKNITYAIPDSKGEFLKNTGGDYVNYHNTQYAFEYKALNLDLSTGEEIPLADLFTDDADYLALLSDAVSKKLDRSYSQDENLYGGYPSIKLTGPFKGISADQKYYATPNGLMLIFDYATPEFYMEGFMAQLMHIPFADLGDLVAISLRFETDRDLYLSESSPVNMLIVNYEASDTGFYEGPSSQEERIQYYRNARYPSDFPEPIKALIEDLAAPDRALMEELESLMPAELPEDVHAYCEQWVSGSRAGSCYTISKTIFGGYKEHSFSRSEYHTYGEDCKELSIEEIFIAGYDYRAAIRKAIAQSIKSSGGIYRDGVYLNQEQTAKEIDRFTEEVQDFLLSRDFVEIMAGPAEFSNRRIENIYCSLPYEEIGCDNLTIFR